MGNLLIFKYLTGDVIIWQSLQDRASRTIVLFNSPRVGECRNDENWLESGMAWR